MVDFRLDCLEASPEAFAVECVRRGEDASHPIVLELYNETDWSGHGG